MVNSMDYSTISHVLCAWEGAKRVTPGFEEQIGLLIIKNLFAAEPRTKQVFGFDEHEDIEHSGLKQMGVLIHAKRLVGMLEATIGLLGPDVETLTEILSQLGRRHINYEVKPEFFPVMGKAIRDALAETLKEEWTKDVDDAWCTVYNELSAEIVKSMLNVA